ncbi:hypothetical protein, partial [Streptomyces scabiei]|uniref:hypothetical protein n=1 Tax=Streptomyces scabiei TaxID=1930 RepID=UPI001B3200DD
TEASVEAAPGNRCGLPAPHRATCADATGEIQFSGRRFTTTADDLERLWDTLPATDDVVVITEPTRNAWVPLAAWFAHRGAKVSPGKP